ncbi:MAG: hypothetical protein KDJ16_00145 [Hyphomicrobiales bacterium]|nr:hypothetical protein [Hyphomicrobiales bacterium]
MKYVLSVAIVCLPAAALAGKTEGETCAAALSEPAQKIYHATAPDVTPSADLKDLVTAKTRSLVISGDISRKIAKQSAEEAGPCLKELQN